MKTPFVKLLAVVALAMFAACPLRAQTNPSSASTNFPAYSNGLIQIDSKGIHIGGPNPVNIKLSDFARQNDRIQKSEWGALAAILCSSAMSIGIVAMALWVRSRREKQIHETVRVMIEKGVPVTPEILASLGRRNYVRSKMLPGLILAGIGAGIIIGNRRVDSGGLIVLFIGLAFLITWLTERGSNNQLPK